ncbi:MAG: MgtC/SapB family protein [Bacteroidetes bacterium]|nr:MgtC/SapB family protein [Bacteroidota bacterium]
MPSWQEILIRLALASVFGALVGLERERRDRTAGMRTHMMVCVGSTLVMLVSAFGFSDVLGTPHIDLDPSRIAAQVISGIGFIGAGTILFSKQGTIRGLTTASGLWTVAAIGLATGGGMYFAALATTIIALIILWGLQSIEVKFSQKFKQKTLRVVTKPNVDLGEILDKILDQDKIEMSSLFIDKSTDEYIIQIKLEDSNSSKIINCITELQNSPTIKEVHWNQ